MTANSTEDNSPQPAPAVARGRPAPAADASPRRWSAAPASPAPPLRAVSAGANTSSPAVFSTDAIRPPATASGRPIRASVESGSPMMMVITATKPPASEASGVTMERLPVTRPRRRHASPAASQTPLALAKPTARHSAGPLGGPSSSSASGSRIASPTPIDQVSAVQTAAARTTLTMRKSCSA